MKDARILVAADVASDAALVKELLQDEFEHINLSTDPKMAVADFDFVRPAVLILAFNTLEKAESYYLGLYRLSTMVQSVAHRTLILCNKEELRRVYELCRKEYFDDYILFWPMTNDVQRLPMAVSHALRDLRHSPGGANAAEVEQRLHAVNDVAAPVRAPDAVVEPVRPLVLLVDDDEFERKLAGEMLRAVPCDLAFAASGVEALDLLRTQRPALILMDMAMPGISGLETLRRLKAATEFVDIPVMMMTGRSEKEFVVECLNAGAMDFVVKPLDREIFLNKVARILALPGELGTGTSHAAMRIP